MCRETLVKDYRGAPPAESEIPPWRAPPPSGGSLWIGLRAFALVFGLPLSVAGTAYVSAQRLPPCEVQTPAPPLASINTGDVNQVQATANRAEIEGKPLVYLPANGVTKIDRALSLQSGQVIDGQGGSLVNGFTSGGRYGRTILNDPDVGFNYYDTISVTGPNTVTLADAAQAPHYRPGQPVYLWRLDGFLGSTGSLRTLHGVSAVSGNTISFLGPQLDRRLTAARWYTAAASVGNVRAGTNSFTVPTNLFVPGDWAYLTPGPYLANSDDGEWHRIAAVTSTTATLELPALRSYPAAVLAKAAPAAYVTLRNLTLSPPPPPLETALLKYAVNWRLDSVHAVGSFWFGSSANCTFTNCVFDTLQLNSCHGMTFVGCTINRLALEEGCFDCRFEGCTLGGVSTTTGCERLAFRACRVTEFIGLTGSDMLVDSITLDENVGMYMIGDRCRLSNIIGGFLFVQQGAGGLVTRCPGVRLGWSSWSSDGVAIDCIGATVDRPRPNTNDPPITWRLLP